MNPERWSKTPNAFEFVCAWQGNCHCPNNERQGIIHDNGRKIPTKLWIVSVGQISSLQIISEEATANRHKSFFIVLQCL